MNFGELEQYSKKNLDKKVLDQVAQWQIYKTIFGSWDIKLGLQKYNPLRKDNSPSFSLFMSKQTGDILWHDFATGETGDCIKLLMHRHNCSYRDALAYIGNNFIPEVREYSYTKKDLPKSRETSIRTTIIDEAENSTLNYHREYWMQYKIADPIKEYRRNFSVWSIRDVYLNDKLFVGSTKLNPVFQFEHHPSKRSKIYRPYAKEWKHFGNVTKNDLWWIKRHTSENQVVYITKSIKDLLVLSNIYNYSNVIAFQSENMFPDSHKLAEAIGLEDPPIVICFDMDEAGIRGRDKLIEMLGLMQYNNIKYFDNLPYKDISDTVKNTGITDWIHYNNYIK